MSSRKRKSDSDVAKVDDIKERIEKQLDPELFVETSTLLEEQRGEVARLKAQVRWLEGKPYRSSSEKVAEGQLALELLGMMKKGEEKPNTAAPEGGAPDPVKDEKEKDKPKRKRRGRDLPREVIESRLDNDDHVRQCACCMKPMAELGFDSQERFIHQPATVTIVEERFYKYACRSCDGGVATCPPRIPPKPIPGSMASGSMLAFLVTSKVLDGLPIERIAKQLRRFGVDLATSTLNDWFGRTSDFFVAIAERLLQELRDSQLISLDDSPLPALNRKHPKNIQKGRQWLYIGNKCNVIYCEFSEDWKGSHPRRILEGFSGDIQGDGYAGINPLFKDAQSPRRIGCNDHARRKFVKALDQGDTRAQKALDLYRVLYAIERRAREKTLDVAAVLALRQKESVPIWRQLEAEVNRLQSNAGKKSPLGKAVTYFVRQGPTLRVFLEDGYLPISNAHVERQIRTVALFRKNSLFVGSLDAGKRYATLLTIMLNCSLVGANPYEYIADVINKIACDWPASDIDALLPRQWQAARILAKEQADGDAAAVA